MDKINNESEKFLDRADTNPDVDTDIIDDEKQKEEILDLLTEIFRLPSFNLDKQIDYKKDFLGFNPNDIDYIDKDYVNILDIDLCNFKDCFLPDHDNVVSFEKYIAYKWNKTGI